MFNIFKLESFVHFQVQPSNDSRLSIAAVYYLDRLEHKNCLGHVILTKGSREVESVLLNGNKKIHSNLLTAVMRLVTADLLQEMILNGDFLTAKQLKKD